MLTPTWIESPPPPDTPDLVPGFLKRSGVLLIAGEHEVGKTLLALEVCHSVLTGLPLWGALPVARPVPRVTYVLGEHDIEVIQGQWQLMGCTVPKQTFALIGPNDRRILVAEVGVQNRNVAEYKDVCQGSGLIVFDPLSAFISGIEAENDSVQMRLLINTMGDIARSTGAALLILHHMGKPTFHQRSGNWVRAGKYEARGASAIEDAATYLFYMQNVENRSNRFTLRKKKFKGRAPDQFYLTREHMRHRATDPHWKTTLRYIE